ncbi:MAG: NAD(P)/FAD-dependent oxidoreductase [Bryobacteraceae bacterium]|jgi:protoporphyrinogen oxidase
MSIGRVAIIGAGPAGLTAAYFLAKNGVPVTVLESDSQYVGGISRTVRYLGFHFDIGGHRFFSKSQEIEDLWTEILPDDLLQRPRSSRILYGGKFYSYPLKAFEALRNLGVLESGLCVLSYLKARLFPVRNPKSLEDWVTNQFGSRLYRIFFKTYTEKVWGMSCNQISADWAAQRIKGLSLASAIWNALYSRKSKDRSKIVKTLIDTFRYPRKGPGMMWETCAAKVRQMGGEVRLGRRVVGCSYDRISGSWNLLCELEGGGRETVAAEQVISSAPIRELVAMLAPAASPEALAAARALKYREFITVALMLKDRERFADNWIYIHDPNVQAGRIQNYKSWSPEMVPDPAYCCYGLEYFCSEGDTLWSAPDAELIELAASELEKIGLANRTDIVDGCAVRQAKAYPVYDGDYVRNVALVRAEIRQRYPKLHLVGRNGMHKYNNQDHAMMTALLSGRNILAGQEVYDVWKVNQDAEYHEEGVTAPSAPV